MVDRDKLPDRHDTIHKIVLGYFAPLATRPFTYAGHTVNPEPLTTSDQLLRGFTCPAGCGGCCPTFTLDYLPDEPHPYPLTERTVDFDGHEVTLFSDVQADNRGPRCHNLLPDDGRCGIHGKQPFACDFELIRFTHLDKGRGWVVGERLFSRGWHMKRTDGGQGAKCTITPATVERALDVARRLDRLTAWADYFGLPRHRGRLLSSYVRTFAADPQGAPRVTHDADTTFWRTVRT
jgi:hypothetical protein